MKKRIGLFCGGFSSEFEISMKSADTIQKHFPKHVDLVKIVVSRDSWYALIDEVSYDFSLQSCSFVQNGEEKTIDLGLIYIHGNPGENGKIQAFLDLKGIPYLNSGALASELSFDKWYCNQFLNNFQIPVAKAVFLAKTDPCNVDLIISQLGLPVFVKPCDSGSSYGISKVKTKEELMPAIEKAFFEGETLVVESFLDGIEVTCGIYRANQALICLPLTEIITENEFFDYEAKYLGESKEITPARVSDEMKNKVWDTAKKCYQLLQLRSIARIDFMLVNGIPYVIEVNTTPGFSPASIVPQMIQANGKTITEFWEEILEQEG